MPIIQVDHVTKEYKPGQLTSLKRTSLDDIAIGAVSVSNAFCRSGFSRENRESVSDPHVTRLSKIPVNHGDTVLR